MIVLEEEKGEDHWGYFYSSKGGHECQKKFHPIIVQPPAAGTKVKDLSKGNLGKTSDTGNGG